MKENAGTYYFIDNQNWILSLYVRLIVRFACKFLWFYSYNASINVRKGANKTFLLLRQHAFCFVLFSFVFAWWMLMKSIYDRKWIVQVKHLESYDFLMWWLIKFFGMDYIHSCFRQQWLLIILINNCEKLKYYLLLFFLTKKMRDKIQNKRKSL